MPENQLRSVLNKLRWDRSHGEGEVTVAVAVREGGTARIEEISYGDVAAVLPGGLETTSGTFIPYHRVLAVRCGETVLWRARKGDGDEA